MVSPLTSIAAITPFEKSIRRSDPFLFKSKFGLGAEIGISTTKIHAYGPMGAKEMTTSRYIVTGNGHIRE